jgi:MFS family permease
MHACAGRRRSLLVALLINAFFGVMSAGARSVGALVAMRLLGGVGVGGSVPVVFSFLAELLPAHARYGTRVHHAAAAAVVTGSIHCRDSLTPASMALPLFLLFSNCNF